MSVPFALLLALMHALVAGGFDDALRLSAQGEHVQALAAAESETDPLRRAQACFYVRHHAGDLERASWIASAAREKGISDAWLLEREAYVALTLGRARTAREALTALGQALDARDPGDPETARLRGSAESLVRETDAREQLDRDRDAALLRARAVVIALAVAGFAAVLWQGLRPTYVRRVRRAARAPRAP